MIVIKNLKTKTNITQFYVNHCQLVYDTLSVNTFEQCYFLAYKKAGEMPASISKFLAKKIFPS